MDITLYVVRVKVGNFPYYIKFLDTNPSHSYEVQGLVNNATHFASEDTAYRFARKIAYRYTVEPLISHHTGQITFPI